MMYAGGRRTTEVVALSLFCIILAVSGNAYAARVVGFLPADGDWQVVGAEMRAGYAVALQRLAETSRPPITLEVLDCPEDSAVLRNTVIELADSDCIGIIGGFPSRSASIIADAATLTGIPYLIDCASADTLTRSSREFVFRLFPPQSDHNDGIVAWAAEVCARGSRTAILCDTGSFHQSLADLKGDLASRWEGEVTIFPYEHGCEEFSSYFDQLAAVRPSIVWLLGSNSENGAFLRQARYRDWNPYAFIVGTPDMVNRRLISYTEGAADYTLGPVIWSAKLPGFGVAEFVKHFRDKTGEDPGVKAVYSYVGLLVMADAIQRANSENRDRLRQSLAETVATSVIGQVRFETFRGYSQQNRPVTYAAQLRGDSWEIVYPIDDASADDIYPAPQWRERTRAANLIQSRRGKLLALAAASLLTAALIASTGLSRRKKK